MDEFQDQLRAKWDGRYREAVEEPRPIVVLTENAHLLPATGTALDLACGLGANARYLAARGLTTMAWDLSSVAIERVARGAAGLPLRAEVRDACAMPPDPASFDVICVGHFLERDLCPVIAAGLRPGGLLFYQTFTAERVDDSGPADGPFRLQANELLRLFPGLLVRFYREEGRVGDTSRGTRNLAQLVAQRPR